MKKIGALGIIILIILLTIVYIVLNKVLKKDNQESFPIEPSKSQKIPSGTTPPQPATNQKATSTSANISKLKIEDIKVGAGSAVITGDTIKVNYIGTLTNGTKFDSSYDRQEPLLIKIGVGQVIKGWDEGIIGMKVGGKRKLSIPANLAYGNSSPSPLIPANSPLIFEIELLEITK